MKAPRKEVSYRLIERESGQSGAGIQAMAPTCCSEDLLLPPSHCPAGADPFPFHRGQYYGLRAKATCLGVS